MMKEHNTTTRFDLFLSREYGNGRKDNNLWKNMEK